MAHVIRSREVAFETPWFSVVVKHVEPAVEGSDDPHYVVIPPDYVTVLAVTGEMDVLLVRQYRPALERGVLELPSGHVDPGEAPAAAAVRELEEETGCPAEEVYLLGQVAPDTGRLGNRLWCYFAPSVASEPAEDWEPESGIQVVRRPAGNLLDMVAGGELEHSHDLAVIALAVSQGRLEDFTR